MKIVIKKNNASLLHAVFILWLFCEVVFEHTRISQLALLIFISIAILTTRKVHWSVMLTGYCMVAVWSVLNIFLGHAMSVSTASKMTQTLFLNIAFLYAFTGYCRYTGDYMTVLRIYKWVAVLFSVPCLIGGMGSVLQGERLSILGINANRIATMMAYSMIIVTYELLQKDRNSRGVGKGVTLALLALTIILTGSRKGLIIPFVGIYLLICARRPRKFIKYSLITLAVVYVTMYVLWNFEPLYEFLGRRVEAVVQFLQGEEFEEGSLLTRDSFITLGWELAQNKPLWGHGLDCFRLARGAYGTYTHCNYIELIYSLGWGGLILYYFPHVISLGRLIKVWRKNVNTVSFLAALLIPFLVCDYTNVTYFERLLLLIPAVVMTVMGQKGETYELQKTD